MKLRLRSVYGVVVALLLAAPAAKGEERPLRILVTNDDGYRSPGLTTLVQELTSVGTVVVSAPAGNRSGSSHSIALSEPLAVEEVTIEGASAAVAVDGTPAAATSFGLLALGEEEGFDLVVSGINRGANVGNVAHYSGTVGAAMEALLHGVPAIAVSQDGASSDFGVAARFTAKLITELRTRGFPEGVLLSVNVPARATRGGAKALAAPMGGSYIEHNGFRRQSQEGGGRSLWLANLGLARSSEPGSDTAAYLEGKITVTPLRFDWTDRELLEALSTWIPELE